MLKEIQEIIFQEIQRDIASFSDPGSIVELRYPRLTWQRFRQTISVNLINSGRVFPDVELAGKRYTYEGFLASEHLADLRNLAESLLTSVPQLKNQIPAPALAKLDDKEISDLPLDEMVLNLSTSLEQLPNASTRVLFIYGDAGIGKTSSLVSATRKQAELYLSGKSTTLLLYLDAQGKGLSQLEDVMARVLQDLRSRFTYHSVATLTKRHCLVPIVDGFDELIGPSTAREAFANLSHFLAQLDREGALLASSRSAFIDYRTLHERASEIARSQGLSFEILPIQVQDWSDSEITKYILGLSDVGERQNLLTKVKGLQKTACGNLLGKPFYLAHVCAMLNQGKEINDSKSLIDQIIQATFERESDKLKDTRGAQLLKPEQHEIFCSALAEEMWWQGKPHLDCETIKVIAEMYSDNFNLRAVDRKLFIDRSIAHGLLRPVQSMGGEARAFEHELIRFSLQQRKLVDSIVKNEYELIDFMSRGEIPLPILDGISDRFNKFKIDRSQIINNIAKIVSVASINPFSSVNAGLLIGALIKDSGEISDVITFNELIFRAIPLSNFSLKKTSIKKCCFEKVVFRNVKFSECVFEETNFIMCEFDEDMNWDGSELLLSSFFGAKFYKDGNSFETYDPDQIAEALCSAGAKLLDWKQRPKKVISENDSKRIKLVEDLANRAQSRFYLSQNDSWFERHMKANDQWLIVKKALMKYGLLIEDQPPQKGRPEIFLRLTLPPDVLMQSRATWQTSKLSEEKLDQFWTELLTK